jgi:hypothetical protein
VTTGVEGDGKDGKDGKNGKDGNADLIARVEVTASGTMLVVYRSDGFPQFRLPILP